MSDIPVTIKLLSVFGIVKIKPKQEDHMGTMPKGFTNGIIKPKTKKKSFKLPLLPIFVIALSLVALGMFLMYYEAPAQAPKKSTYQESIESDKATIARTGCTGLFKFRDANPNSDLLPYIQQQIYQKGC